ncbi:protein of unknown function [Maridesulfovibrio hydrothermalis AM13 = DSM 14728]|uniref:Uncharacterized protein n=1 Tax=Maridesulfovibrio hydrothermalis AM13 = DSM 14728 TaxID=1121451 RepID=L0RE79_9BACT|nr:protein of unknown function [Maridesulfovibrio hydrothermalis AM13 = DSM 14728]
MLLLFKFKSYLNILLMVELSNILFNKAARKSIYYAREVFLKMTLVRKTH